MIAPERRVAGLPSRLATIYLLLFAAAFATYSVLWRHAPVEEGDSPQYLEVAGDLSDGRLDALHDRTPGYPLLLVLTGSHARPARLLLFVGLALHFACIWLLATVLHHARLPRAWLIAFCGGLLLPPYVEPAGYVMTENLAQFTLVVGFACLALWFAYRRAVLLFVSGLAFGYSGITRPAYQALAIAIAACLLVLPSIVRRARITYAGAARAGAVVIAGSLVVLGLLSWKNYAKFHYFGVIPSLGFHLSTKTMNFVERLPDEYAAVREVFVRERDAQLVKRGGTHSASQTVWSIRPELMAITGLSNAELSAYLLKMNLTLIRRAPMEYLQDVARSMAVYWFPPAGALASMNSGFLRWLWAAVHVGVMSAFFLQLIVLTGIVAVRASTAVAGINVGRLLPAIDANEIAATAYVLAGVIVFYTMIISCALDIGEVRQRRSTDVFVVFMCFLGAHVWLRSIVSAPEP